MQLYVTPWLLQNISRLLQLVLDALHLRGSGLTAASMITASDALPLSATICGPITDGTIYMSDRVASVPSACFAALFRFRPPP